MKVIHLEYPHSYNKNDFPPLAIALGFFDGIHKGHQQVFQTVKQIANEQQLHSAVMTFDPHPSIVLGKKDQVHYITPLKEKQRLIASLEIDYLFIVHFTKTFSNLTPEEFVEQYLVNLNAEHVVAGFDYTYGKFGRGTMETMKMHSQERFQVTIVPKLVNNQEKISSTAIRHLIREGQMAQIRPLLNRFYETKGVVIKGDQRGNQIGYPTANIDMQEDYLLPKTGVYAVEINIKNQWYVGMCNVGYRPTFKDPNESALSIEVHILQFNQMIYGETVTIKWHKRIRDEKKFNGIDELIGQLDKDAETIKQYFTDNGNLT